jgi:hypothetical protein
MCPPVHDSVLLPPLCSLHPFAILHLMSSLSEPTCIYHWSFEIQFSHLPLGMKNSPYKASHSFILSHFLTLLWAPTLVCTTSFMLGLLCLLGLFFDPEDGASMLLQNLIELLPDYAASYPRRRCTLQSPLRKSQISCVELLFINYTLQYNRWLNLSVGTTGWYKAKIHQDTKHLCMWYRKLTEHFAINVSNVSKNNYVGILFLLSNKYSCGHFLQ